MTSSYGDSSGNRRAWTGGYRRLATPLPFVFPLPIAWGLAASLVVVAWRRRGKASALQLAPTAASPAGALRVLDLGFFALAAVMLLAPCFAGLGFSGCRCRGGRLQPRCSWLGRCVSQDSSRLASRRGGARNASRSPTPRVDDNSGRPKQRPSRSFSATRSRGGCFLISTMANWRFGIWRRRSACCTTGGAKQCTQRRCRPPTIASTRVRVTPAMRGS